MTGYNIVMKNHVIVFLLGFIITASAYVYTSSEAEARRRCGGMKNDKSHCGLWLCIPAGMGAGCGAMAAALGKRMSRGCPALPNYAVCASGGEGSQRSGREDYRKCDPGFTTKTLQIERDDKPEKRPYCVNRDLGTYSSLDALRYKNRKVSNPCTDAGYQMMEIEEDGSKVCGYFPPERKYNHWIEVSAGGQTYKRFWHDGRGNGPKEGTREYELNALEALGLNSKEAYKAYKAGTTARSIEEQKQQEQINALNKLMPQPFNFSASPQQTTKTPNAIGTAQPSIDRNTQGSGALSNSQISKGSVGQGSSSTPQSSNLNSTKSSRSSNASNNGSTQKKYRYDGGSQQRGSTIVPGTNIKESDLPTRQIITNDF